MKDVLDRSGHLSELALDVYRYDGARPDIDAHLATCERCRAALSALLAEDQAAVVPAPRRAPPKSPWTGWAARGAALGLLAMAAIVFLVTRPPAGDRPDDGDTLRLKSGAFDFEVFVHDGQRSRAVVDGDVVHPGERMGFRVRVREQGYLLVIGHDDQGHTYMCYPPGEVGASAALPFPATLEPQVLPVAMRFDDILGSEHIVALLCPAPVGAADIAMDARMRDGCVIHELSLNKQPRAGGPGGDGPDGTAP